MRARFGLSAAALLLAGSPLAMAQSINATSSIEVDCQGFDLTFNAVELPASTSLPGMVEIMVEIDTGDGFTCEYPTLVASDENGLIDTTLRFPWCVTPTGDGTVDGGVRGGGVLIPFDQPKALQCAVNEPTECSGRIGDFVWNDGTADVCDGNRAADDVTGLKGVELALRDAAGNVVATTFTGERMIDGELRAGYYAFRDLCAGSYEVSVVSPEGFNRADDDAAMLVDLAADDTIVQGVDFAFCAAAADVPTCLPGDWRRAESSWDATGYSRKQRVGDLFVGATDFYGYQYLTLWEALRGGDPLDNDLDKQARKLIRHGVAALLNANSPAVDYALSEAEVLTAVEAALNSADIKTIRRQKRDLRELNKGECVTLP